MRVPRRFHHEDGLTLAELLVTLAVLGVVLTMASQSAFGLFRTTALVEERNVNADQGRLAMSVASRAFRAAATPVAEDDTVTPMFLVADPTRAVFHASLAETDEDAPVTRRVIPLRIELRIADGQLLETRTPPVLTEPDRQITYPASGTTTRVVAEYVDDTSRFEYFEADRATAVSDLDDIAFVRISVTTSRDAEGGSPTTMTTDVRVASTQLAG